MELTRSCGVLLHITSLAGRYGTGTMGSEAREFIDLLADNGITYWQILPTGPVSKSMGYSPYSSLSCFAGNELFIDTDSLKENTWFRDEVPPPVIEEKHFADFESARRYTFLVLEAAWDNFLNNATGDETEDFNNFCLTHGEQWLDEYALYRVLSEKYGTYNWLQWDNKIITRDRDSIRAEEADLKERIIFWKFCQYVFFNQWLSMKEYAQSRNIRIIGDIPIYMSMESADSWTSINTLEINYETMTPELVAGVPPDYYSSTGQLWGNPVYKWHNDSMELMRKHTPGG